MLLERFRNWAAAPSQTESIFRLFHKSLGLVYMVALVPLLYEVDALIGSNGLLPAKGLLEMSYADQGVIRSLLQFPSLYHLYPSDLSLYIILGIGVLGALLLLLTRHVFLGAFLAWISFLSVTSIGGDFLIIIIDLFLAEVGFLALFSTYLIQYRGYVPKLVHFSFLMLNFRLWFCMGVNKFYMPSSVWVNFEFFDTFFQAQPMPTPVAYYFHQVPRIMKWLAEIGLFIGEVFIPFAVFGGKKLRKLSFWTFVAISVLIQLNGNYGYFNVLSIVAALTILKDDDFGWFRKLNWKDTKTTFGIPRFLAWILSAQIAWQVLYSIYVFEPTPYSAQNHLNIMFNTWKTDSKVLNVLYEPFRWIGYWRVCNPYGVFKGIPKYHGELRFSGSINGEEWKDYEFRFLPSGKTDQIGFFAPYYPRLDHLMFYETLSESNCRHNPLNPYYTLENAWSCNFVNALFSNNGHVTKLLRKNPFEDEPPKFIRTEVYRLSFDECSKGYWKSERMDGMGRVYDLGNCSAPLINYKEAMATVYGVSN
ncbi:MAG: hypothetical protein GC178_03360 [Flavobacteriales bacterium]|nr:hypothetical protein [Flavobacteriales bacterium]